MDLLMLICVTASLSVFLIVAGAAQLRQGSALGDRLTLSLGADDRLQLAVPEQTLARPFSERVLLPLIRAAGRVLILLWPEHRLKLLQARLALAGSPGGLRAIDLIGLRLLTGGLFLGIGALYLYASPVPASPPGLLLAAVFTVCGFLLPDLWVSRRITLRREEILNALPDALDMLTITTEAGLSFESGLQELMQKWDNELCREFGRALRDIGMGQSRRYALNCMAERTGVPDVQSFVAALNQAEELGVSIGRVLRAQSDDLRTRRRQRAHERANQVPVKMMFPLVFLIFPAIFVVLLGPAIPQLLSFGG